MSSSVRLRGRVGYGDAVDHGSRFGFPGKSQWCDFLPDLQANDQMPWFREIIGDLDAGWSEVDSLGPCLMLGGYSYLGLNRRPEIREAVIEALDRFGSGSAGSRWLAGHTDLHRELEERLAVASGTEDALSFASGFVANASVIPALVGRRDEVFGDRSNHASLVDGCQASGAKFTRFRHNDLQQLEQQLRASTAKRRLIAVDGITSMAGTISRVDELVSLAERYEALLLVDECHSHFVVGASGGGVADHFNLDPASIDLQIGTVGKALHAAGGYVAGSKDLCNYLRRSARGFVYSRSLSPMDVAAAIAALKIFEAEGEELLRRLHSNRRVFVDELRAAGMTDLQEGPSPIVPILVRSSFAALESAVELQRQNVLIHPVVAPVVPHDGAILRASIMASHRPDDLKDAARRIVKVVQHYQEVYENLGPLG